ncbi:MAG: septation protein A [Alphaproteobacteria bacterium]|nr:septation protein A [Alphaproteobacteria bacterium]
MKAVRRLLIEAGPLAAFFIANARYDIYVATAVFMAAVGISLAASWLMERRVPTLPLVTAVFVLIFGGLTLLLHDETFIKLKPTIVNSLFGVILLGGLAFGRALLKPLLDYSFQLTDQGWSKLTLRWALFFLLLAVLNEVVWRGFSTDTWVSFKVFGVMPLTLVFALSQVRFLMRYQLREEPQSGG